jgi:hypothetical protein
MERFGGEKFDPAERGRGANWTRWKKVSQLICFRIDARSARLQNKNFLV